MSHFFFSFRVSVVYACMVLHMQVTKPLLETSRKGYLTALSASSYSFVSLLKHFLPIMNPGLLRWFFFPPLFVVMVCHASSIPYHAIFIGK